MFRLFPMVARGAGVLCLIGLMPGLPMLHAAPDADKPVTGRVVPRASSKAKFKGKLSPGVVTEIGPKRVKKYILVNGKLVEIPEGPGTSSAPQPTPVPRVATGRRVKISARFVVTNSDDGMQAGTGFIPVPEADKRVELQGNIYMGGQTAFAFSVGPGIRNLAAGNERSSNAMTPVTLRYNDPNHRFFKVHGKIVDVDSGSGNDNLWVASENIDLIRIMESNAEHRIQGDRNSESGDLYIRVTNDGEVFN